MVHSSLIISVLCNIFQRRKGYALFASAFVAMLFFCSGCGDKHDSVQSAKYSAVADTAYKERRYSDALELYTKALEYDKLNFSANLGMAKLADCWQRDNLRAIQYYLRCMDLPGEEDVKNSLRDRVDILRSITTGVTEDPAMAAMDIIAAAEYLDMGHLLLRLSPEGCGKIVAQGGADSFMRKLKNGSLNSSAPCWREFTDAQNALVVIGNSAGMGSGRLSLLLHKSPEGFWVLNNFSIL